MRFITRSISARSFFALFGVSLALVAVAGSAFAAAGIDRGGFKGKLVVWALLYKSDPVWTKVLDNADLRFERAHPGVTIEHVAQPQDYTQFSQIVRAAIAAKSGPDVIVMFPGGFVHSFEQGLAPLHGLVDPKVVAGLTGTGALTFDKQLYALPMGREGNMFFYNKKLFAKAGLDPNKPPVTFSALLNAATKLKAAGITPFAGGNKEGYENVWMFSLLFPATAKWADTTALAQNRIKFTNPLVANAFQQYLQLTPFFPAGFLSTPLFSSFTPFADGTAAIAPCYSGCGTKLLTGPNVSAGDIGIFGVPTVGGQKVHFQPIGPNAALTITRFSTQKPAAAAYIDSLVSTQVQNALFANDTIMPNTKTANLARITDPMVLKIYKYINSFPQVLNTPHGEWLAPVLNSVAQQINLVIAGGTSLSNALSTIQSVQDQQIR